MMDMLLEAVDFGERMITAAAVQSDEDAPSHFGAIWQRVVRAENHKHYDTGFGASCVPYSPVHCTGSLTSTTYTPLS